MVNFEGEPETIEKVLIFDVFYDSQYKKRQSVCMKRMMG